MAGHRAVTKNTGLGALLMMVRTRSNMRRLIDELRRRPASRLGGMDGSWAHMVRLLPLTAEATVYLFLLLILGASAIVGTPVTTGSPHDFPILLDGAWRVYRGQSPHTDFYSPLGPLPYIVGAVGFHLFGLRTASWQFANLLLSCAIAVTGYVTLRRRLSPLGLAATVFMMAILPVANRMLGFPAKMLTMAAIYNRWGESLLILLTLNVLIARRDSERVAAWVPGALLGLLFLLKLSYFGVALAVVGLSGALNRASTRQYLILGAVAVLVVASICGVYSVNVVAMLRDVDLAAKAQGTAFRGQRLFEVIAADWINLGLYLLVAALGLAEGRRLRVNWLVLAGGYSVFLGNALLLASTNTQWGDLIQLWLGACVMVAYLRHRREQGPGCKGTFAATVSVDSETPVVTVTFPVAAIGWLCLMVLSTSLAASVVVGDLRAVSRSIYRGLHALRSSANVVRIHAAPLQDWPLLSPSGGQWWTKAVDSYGGYVESGLVMLRRNLEHVKRPTVAVLDFSNPFSFALQLDPPEGGATWWHAGWTFSQRASPDPERAFGGVEMIMIPLHPTHPPTARALVDIYGSYLLWHFGVVDKSAEWVLLVRHPPGAAPIGSLELPPGWAL